MVRIILEPSQARTPGAYAVALYTSLPLTKEPIEATSNYHPGHIHPYWSEEGHTVMDRVHHLPGVLGQTYNTHMLVVALSVAFDPVEIVSGIVRIIQDVSGESVQVFYRMTSSHRPQPLAAGPQGIEAGLRAIGAP